MSTSIPPLLQDLLNARSPSSCEDEAQAVIDAQVQPRADHYEIDVMGNRLAFLNPEARPRIMLAGHIDEIGLQIIYVNDDGFLYFDTLGGHNATYFPGRSVTILGKEGTVPGVIGRLSLHLQSPEERKKIPEKHECWIDIGARNKEEAQSLVTIGDCAVYDHHYQRLMGNVIGGRNMDNKAGCYAVNACLLQLAEDKANLAAGVVAASTVQEEVGCRGAQICAEALKPDIAIAVDVGFAVDHPETDKRRIGDFKLGGGPILTRGPNVSAKVYNRLVECCEKASIPYQIEADPRPQGTDAKVLQMAGEGVASAIISIPLRYMHSPNEVIDLSDVEETVRLLKAFCLSFRANETL